MTFRSAYLLAALAMAKVNPAASSQPCLAACEIVNGEKQCKFIVRRNRFAGELGYFTFEGKDGDCGKTNPTLGIEKGVMYRFIQEDASNYYHALGFAYYPDGALDDQPELEPGIRGPGSSSDCESSLTCPAPMYILDGEYLGAYSNNNAIAPITQDIDDFGLDAYEPQFFNPFLDWVGAGTFEVALRYDLDDFNDDFFYFCHIHQYMSGRFKFVDSSGNAINAEDFPEIQYEYDVPSDYDQSCGTVGLEDFQLPNPQCPDKFVCDQPGGKVGKYAECVDSMNCAMLVGMTTNVYQNNAIALFNHQMIPHHQNAVNMCKSLFKSGEVECDDVEDEEDPSCVITVLCHEIINVQNFQIQTMRGVLDALDLPQEDDCVVPIEDDSTSPPKTPVPSEPAPKPTKRPKKPKKKEKQGKNKNKNETKNKNKEKNGRNEQIIMT